MTKEVFLIEQLWTDSMENTTDGAVGYSAVGVAPCEDIAKRLVADAGMVEKVCWAMSGPMPKLRYKPLPTLAHATSLSADPIENVRLRLHQAHLERGPLPTWMELYQGFIAAHDKLVSASEPAETTRTSRDGTTGIHKHKLLHNPLSGVSRCDCGLAYDRHGVQLPNELSET